MKQAHSSAKINVSYHSLEGDNTIEHHAVSLLGLCKDSVNHLAVPLRIKKDQQNVYLRDICTIPDEFMDIISEDLITIERNEHGEEQSIPMTHPLIVEWLSTNATGYFVVYHSNAIRITKINEAGQGRCVKQNVVATLIAEEGGVFVGTNRCNNPQIVCPRDEQGMKSGDGYHLCKEICQQVSHAEVDAIAQAGDKAKGAVIYLSGHHYACGNCRSTAELAAAKIEVRHDRN